jgi:hypothetical protein
MFLSPLLDLVDPSQLTLGQAEFLATLLGKCVHFARDPDLCGLLRRGKLSLSRSKEILILSSSVAGLFGL